MLWDPLGAWKGGRRWVWTALAFAVAATQGASFVRSFRPPRDVVMDFFQEWSAARNLFHGLPIYTDQRTLIEYYMGRVDPSTVFVKVNAHPPTSVLLAVPLALLNYFDAAFVWNLISLAALIASLWLVARELEIPLTPAAAMPLVTLTLLCSPLRQQIYQGQLNLVLLLLLTCTWAADRSGRALGAGVFLGAATAIKLFPGFLLLYFVLRRQWRTLAAALLTLAGLSALTAAVLGPQVFAEYAGVVPHLGRFRGWWNNVSLTGFCYRLFDPTNETPGMGWRIEPLWRSPALARVSSLLLSAGVVAAVVPVTLQARSRVERDLAFSACLTAMLLVSPIAWDHYFLILLVPLAVVWTQLPDSGAARLGFLAILAGFWTPPALLGKCLISAGQGGVVTAWQGIAVLSLPGYALLTLLALEIYEARRSRAAFQTQALSPRDGSAHDAA